MRGEFVGIVQRATGRRVRACHSQIDSVRAGSDADSQPDRQLDRRGANRSPTGCAPQKSAVGVGFVVSERVVRVRGRPYDEEETLTKSEFVESIAGDFASKKAAADAVESILDGIADTLAGGGEVNFTGFGKFSVAERGPRQGVNPRTGERITIAGGRVPKFSAGAGLKSKVKG